MPTYKIDLTNQNYINAIIKYNQKIKISSIKYDGKIQQLSHTDEKNTGNNLLTLLAKAKESGAKSIEISYTSNGAGTLFAVFPRIEPINDEDYKLTPGQEAIVYQYSLVVKQRLYHMGVLHSRIAQLDPVSLKEAADTVRRLAARTGISGALHLPKRSTILFESKGICYSLVYGENPSCKMVKGITFSIDHGFSFRQLNAGYNFVRDLNDYFSLWQQNNYNDAIFPDSSGINSIYEQKIVADCNQEVQTCMLLRTL